MLLLYLAMKMTQQKRYFNIGCPLDMKTPVCLDLERLLNAAMAFLAKQEPEKHF